MRIAIIYGTRPEFLKLKVLITKFRQIFDTLVIRINQHVHFTEDQGYYDKLIDIENLSTDRINNIGANILSKLPEEIKNRTHVLTQGDTATALYALLVGFQMHLKCIHLEAGMRTYDLNNPYPEEGFRQMISRIADIHLCPSEIEKKFLLNENIVNKNIYVVGNTILDLVKTYNIKVTNNNKVLITLHRRENWDNYSQYIESIFKLASANNTINFYFLTHPNPSLRSIIDDITLKQEEPIINLNIIEPLPHFELIELLSQCVCVITDSGGIQEEANFLGKHIYMIRKITERNSIDKNKITVVDNIASIDIQKYKNGHEPGYEYGCGTAVEQICDILK